MQTLLGPLAYVLAFVAVVLLFQTLAGVFFSREETTRKVNRRLTLLQSGMKPEEVYTALVRRPASRQLFDERLASVYERIGVHMRQGGILMSPTRLFVFIAIGAAVLWLISLAFVARTKGAGVIVDGSVSLMGAAMLSLLAAWMWVNGRRTARLKKLEEQMPLALDIVNRALRAGHPVVSAVQLAATEMGDPIGSEFGLIVDETTYGMEFRDALVSFARRSGSADAHFFAVSVGIQSETGGNLAEILEGLATVIRGRATLAKRVKSLASEGKMSAVILSALPILLVGFLLLIEPQFYVSKFNDPVFWPVVIGVLLLYILGQFMINRIINFKY